MAPNAVTKKASVVKKKEQAPPSSKNLTKPERAASILDTADNVLARVERAEIFKHLEVREFPEFELEEIEFGPELGIGGFSRVQEVTNIKLKNSKEEAPNPIKEDLDECEQLVAMMMNKKPSRAELDAEEAHYDISTARETIAKQCIRKGSGARYAVKKLKKELDEVGMARGALDLAIEIKYFKVLWHPNIVKMRGIAKTKTPVSVDTFLLLDRLYGTLNSKFEEWEQLSAMHRASGGGCCGGGGPKNNDPATIDFLKTRLLVAYDLTCAFQYLHQSKLIYRDIKPENIGFDIRGDVKVFDFGLCRSFDKKDKVVNGYGYELTAKTGSIPYMAPEVALGKPYDMKADVFSFSVLLWEILSLSWAFNGYDIRDYFEKVVHQHQRMPIGQPASSWPSIIKSITKEGWDKDPQKRPDMKRMGTLIRAELNELDSEDSAVLNRTKHMLNRSRHSFRMAMGDGSFKRRFLGGDGSGSMRHPRKDTGSGSFHKKTATKRTLDGSGSSSSERASQS